MSPICTDLIVTSEYLFDATDLYTVVKGSRRLGWHPVVRGIAQCGSERDIVWVADYELEYVAKADAVRRAHEMLRYVRLLRQLAGREGV